jgi:chromate transporter
MRERAVVEVLLTFLRLGLTSFGGPIAHFGYFRDEIVRRRRWIDDASFTELVALCQFLPGPASSQLGFSLGLIRAGYWGALAAWVGFTLPSALLLTAFAYGAGAHVIGSPGVSRGLRLAAVAIVAQAVWGMARSLCPDRPRVAIASLAALIALTNASFFAQLAGILVGAAGGLWLCRSATRGPAPMLAVPEARFVGWVAIALFLTLLLGLNALRGVSPQWQVLDAFYRSGALVFGGGHVVLPLLSHAFVAPGWIAEDAFLDGYGAAQAMPGPLFAFAAYLGARISVSPHGMVGAVLGTVAIFLPGFLILLGTLPFWNVLRQRVGAQATVRGVNAAVVGLLGAALYDPLWTHSISSVLDFAVALAGFVLLTALRTPPIAVVILCALAGIVLPPEVQGAPCRVPPEIQCAP